MNTTNDVILKYHFSKYLDDDLHLGFYPYFIGHEKCVPSKPVSRYTQEGEYIFHFILEGAGYVTHRGKTVRLKANDVFYIPPEAINDEETGYYPDPEEPWEYIWFNFIGDGAAKLAEAAKLSFENNYYSVQKPAVLRQELTEMINIAKNTAKRNTSFYLPYIMRFFAEIADERKIGDIIATEKEKKVKIILDYIEHNYSAQDFSIKGIADKMFYTTSYVSRIFMEVTGKTPVDYVTSLRMLKALDMLRSNNYSISQIAYEIGYNSPFYFSKKFKEYFGYPPSKFSN